MEGRIAKYNTNVGCMQTRPNEIQASTVETKQIILRAILQPIILFGGEYWTLTKS